MFPGNKSTNLSILLSLSHFHHNFFMESTSVPVVANLLNRLVRINYMIKGDGFEGVVGSNHGSSNLKGGVTGSSINNNNKNSGSNGLGSYKPSFLASQMRESSSFELGVSRLKRSETSSETSSASSSSSSSSSNNKMITGSLIGETLTAQLPGAIVGGALIIGKSTMAATMVDSTASMVNQQIVSDNGEQQDIIIDNNKTGSWSTSTVSDLLF